MKQRNGILNKHPQEIPTTFRRNTISVMVDVGILKWDGVMGTGDGRAGVVQRVLETSYLF